MLFWIASLSVSSQGIVIDQHTLHRWAANRALADTLLDEADGDFRNARRLIGELRSDMDTCQTIAARANDRSDQYAHELEVCQEENGHLDDKVKRLRVWAWISRIGLTLGAVFAVKELVDQSKP